MKNLHVLLMVSLLTCAGGVAIAQDYDAGLKAAQAGDFQTALKEWKPLADQGHADAQYNLGLMYANGEGVVEDDAEAVRWFRLAADQGLADAQVFLGMMYASGEGVPEDDAEAVRWLRLAADQGLAEAVRWYRLAADQGLAGAQLFLGWMYANGRGVPEDDAEAAGWLRLAADQGLADAQVFLGMMYASGEGVPEDDAEAVRWLRLAADQGLAEAAGWYRLLPADQGLADACRELLQHRADAADQFDDRVQADHRAWHSALRLQGLLHDLRLREGASPLQRSRMGRGAAGTGTQRAAATIARPWRTAGASGTGT